MKYTKKHMTSRGFTLIELLVVITIIGTLAGLLFTNFSGARERARDAKRKNDVTQIKSALRLYYNDHQKYPLGNNTQIAGCGLDGTSTCSWGTAFTAGAGPTIYMNQLPTDPISTQSYSYAQIDDDSYQLTATLENAGDDSAIKSQLTCGILPGATVAKIYMTCQD
ncbi:MAG: type II secretion system protein [Patescibacteria group bacterium]